MGLIRGGLMFVVVVLLFWSFLAGNVFLTLSMSLDYDVIQPELSSSIKGVIGSQMNLTEQVDNRLEAMEIYCVNNSESFVFSEGDYTFDVPCEVVPQGSGVIEDYLINDIIEKSYYQEYECSFIDCIRNFDLKQPFFLVSAKAYDYWKNKFYFSLIVSIILVVLVFFLVEQKFNFPIVVGTLMILSSLPFMKINSLISLFTNEFYAQFFNIFLSKSYTVFLIMFILGIFILAIGLTLRFFKFGFWVSELFDKLAGKGEGEKTTDVKKVIEPVVVVKKSVGGKK